ncbi:hypothetical protein HOY80DRAFT_1048567 [Tuber brumale]|nr:hypothetical protein HOY80DRAFT_1048567 [Tuber brumale]
MTENNISFPHNPRSNRGSKLESRSKLESSPSPEPSDSPRIISRANFSASQSAEEIEARIMVSFHSGSHLSSYSETAGSESTILDEDNDLEYEPVPILLPALPESSSMTQASALALHHHNSSLETRSIVQGLQIHAGWSYAQLKNTFQVLLGTLHRIIHSSNTPERHLYLCHGHPITISPEVQLQLINTTTVNAHNYCLPLTQIANLAGVRIGA